VILVHCEYRQKRGEYLDAVEESNVLNLHCVSIKKDTIQPPMIISEIVV